MKILILLHSTTGNTRLVTRYAAEYMRQAGHEVVVHDIVRRDALPAMDDVDLLGVASPTMYFRGTYAMERVLARMPNVEGAPRPAFLLVSAAGDPGDHMPLQAEQLAYKGWRVIAGRLVIAPSNWPQHIAAARPLEPLAPLAESLVRRVSAARLIAAFAWPNVGVTDERGLKKLERFLDETLTRAAGGSEVTAASPDELGGPFKVTRYLGRMFQLRMLDLGLQVHEDACSRCGLCVRLCPSGAMQREDDDALPRAEEGCTGCWACYNGCPERAISGKGAPRGHGQYPGPPLSMRRVFSTH
jgi:ferredoxin/menaquinone-dependent protoporphyrinogen IX oxidase